MPLLVFPLNLTKKENIILVDDDVSGDLKSKSSIAEF